MADGSNPDDHSSIEKTHSVDPDAPAPLSRTSSSQQKTSTDETASAMKKKKKSSKEDGGKRAKKKESKDELNKPQVKKSGSHRGEMKFGEKPTVTPAQSRSQEHPPQEDRPPFDPNDFQRMTAIYFHRENDLSRSARGVGYTPEQAVPKHGPGVTDEVEHLYGPCTLLSDFKYSTWTETVVPLRNHNVVQGFNEMILFLMKLAADPEGQVNHEEAFMATSFLSNIRNDLGEHPPNVLALLEYIDYKTRNDGTEPANPSYEVINQCEAIKRY